MMLRVPLFVIQIFVLQSASEETCFTFLTACLILFSLCPYSKAKDLSEGTTDFAFIY